MLHYIKEHKFDCTEGLANMQVILIIAIAIIVPVSLLSPASILSLTHSARIAYALTNVTGNNETGNVPNLITTTTTPSPVLSSVDQGDGADVNRTNTTQSEPPTQTVLQPQQFTFRADFGSEIVGGQTVRGGGNQTQESNNPLLEPITKEQAAKAEQEANVMIKAYYEELEEKNKASALATAQPNQTMGALQEETGCVAGEVSVQVGNSTVCLSSYEISIACNPGGSLVGDPICSTAADDSSIQQPAGNLPSPEVEQEEVIEESGGQGQVPGGEEEEVLEEGDAGEQQEVIEEFE
jgi:hypothetical protein